jgi:hypothetical protein
MSIVNNQVSDLDANQLRDILIKSKELRVLLDSTFEELALSDFTFHAAVVHDALHRLEFSVQLSCFPADVCRHPVQSAGVVGQGGNL